MRKLSEQIERTISIKELAVYISSREMKDMHVLVLDRNGVLCGIYPMYSSKKEVYSLSIRSITSFTNPVITEVDYTSRRIECGYTVENYLSDLIKNEYKVFVFDSLNEYLDFASKNNYNC